MFDRIFPKLNHDCPQLFLEVLRGVLGKLTVVGLLLFFTSFSVFGQSNLTLSLGEESVLLDQLVVCGTPDEQAVVFTLAGTDTAPRTTITATLDLFPGIAFSSLNTTATTAGVTLMDGTNPNRPVFSLPDLAPTALTEVTIVFSVNTDCAILDTLGTSNLKIFDTWQLAYQMGGAPFSETFNGVEYKDAIVVPNLNLTVPELAGSFGMGMEVRRQLTVSNSGLNSYLTTFDYQVIQEAGISYQSLLINGTPINFKKEVTTNRDTLITATIIGDLFIGNTKEQGAAGNNDLLFDVDEILTIEEVLILTSCGNNGDSNLGTAHEVNWGCNTLICQAETKAANLPIGMGEALIGFTHNSEVTVDAGYCEGGNLAIAVANNGFEFDDDFGAILNIATGVGFAIGTEFLSADQGYEITSLTIGSSTPINAPDGLIDLNNNPAFATDPDGVGGLEDVDGDGFFDDLRVGQNFMITATYGVSCSIGNQFDLDSDCDNDFRGNFDGKIEFTNGCGDRAESLFDNFYRSANTGATREVCTDPDAFNDNDQFTIIYNGERRMSNFSRTCLGNDEVRISVTLPEGIALSNQTSIQQDTTQYFPTAISGNGESVMTFDAAVLNLNNDYQVDFVFETQCAPVGPTSFPVEITYFCPECSCSHIWYCGILEGAILHAAGAPCAEFVCETGLQTTNFSVERSTFGFTDASFSTPFDAELANKKVALSCDSVLMKMTNVVGNQNLTDSVGLTINYNNADGSDSEITSFLFAFANVTIQSGGNTRTCVLDTTAYRVEVLGSNKTMYFDLSSCLGGITLNSGDQISFEGHFAVNPDGPIPSNTFRKIPVLRGSGYAIIDGQTYDDCDSFGELFRLAKLNTTFSGPNNSTFPQGCAASVLQYTVSKSINANAMREFFGEEHRQAVTVDSLTLTYDPAILTAFEDLSVEYRIQGGQWFPLPNLLDLNAGFYQAGFSALNTASTITGSNQVFQFRVNLIPSCSSQFGSSTEDDLYEIEANLTYQNRAYAVFDDIGDCAETNEVFDKRFFQYLDPPTFSLEAVVNDVQSGEETIQWIIEHCNTSFESDAEVTFIQFEKQLGDAEILFLEDISFPATIDTLVLQTFNGDTSVFAFANRLSKRGTNVAPADICNTFRITARMNSCGENSVIAGLGWNCAAYDSINWTPDLYPPCEEETLLLKAATLEPLLSASFQAAESIISGVLCDTSTMVILVRNEEEGNAFDIQSQIILPTGATLVPNSVEFAYPSTANFQPITAAPNFLGDDPLGQIYQYDDFGNLSNFLQENGLPGFSINAPDSSEFKIKYRFITNCAYQNGELNRYSFQGTTACGTPTNNAFAETNPIIFQADPSVARNFDIEFTSAEILVPNQVATFQIQVENIGNNVSAVDKIEIELPEAFTYVANSIQVSTPDNWMPSEPTIKNNAGVDVFNLLLPTGLAQNEQAVFQFNVNVGNLACDSVYATRITTTSTIEFTCTVDGETCNYDFNSSNEGEFELNTSCEAVACNISVGTENLTILMPDCDSTIFYCFNQYTATDIENYTVSDNGIIVDSSRFEICDFNQICIYTYAQINNATGDIRVDSWIVDGVTYTGTVSSIEELVDSMNVWDEDGNWVILSEALIIQGGHLGGDYSRMEITFPSSGIRSFLGYDTRLTPLGLSVFLTEGFHQLILTNPSGCMDTLNIDVVRQECPSCTPPIIESIITENASCNQENGSTIINITGNIADYNFNWSPNVGGIGATANSRINLPTASYFVQIVDKVSNECFETVLVNVGNSDAPNASFTKVDATCGMANGRVDLSPTNYTYTWNDGVVGPNRNDLPEGRYMVTVTDEAALDCTNLLTIEIGITNPLIVTHTVVNTPTCLSNNGIVTLNVTGGSGGYKSTFPNGSLTQTDLPSGAFDLVITDTISGCSTPYLFVLNDQVNQGIISIIDTTSLVCSGDENGRINFEVIYEDGFRFPADTIITDGQFRYENGQLPEGNFEIHIRDGNGCVAGSRPFEIKVPNPLIVDISTTGDCPTGQAIRLNVQGGLAPYNFDWADIPGGQNERDRTDLPESTYEVTISDGNDCLLPLTINLDTCTCLPATIIDTTFIAADCGESNGVVVIEIAEAIADYSFIYEPNLGQEGATKNTRMALPAGDYLVLIAYQGDTTCATNLNITIPENSIPANLISATNILPADCGQSNGVVSIELTAPIAAYTFIYEPDLGQEGATKNTRMALPAGTYEVIIALEDATDCAISRTITVTENSLTAELVTASEIIAADCGQSNGAITLSIAGDVTDFDYEWSGSAGQAGATPNSRTNLSAGTYDVIITNTNSPNCTTVFPFTIPTGEIGDSPLIDTLITAANCGLEDGQVTFVFGNNTIEYTYEWTPNLGTEGNLPNTRLNLPAGDYEVTIIDPENPACNYPLNLTIDLAPPIATATVFPSICENPPTGVAVLSPDTYIYTWPDGFIGSDRNELAVGTYEITFTNANAIVEDCRGTINVIIEAENLLTAEAVIDQSPTCEADNGMVSLNVTGGSGDYSYSWASETNSSSDLAPGSYMVTVFDATLGCQTIVDFELTAIPIGVATIIITDTINVSCTNGMDGSIQFSVEVADDFQLPMDTLITDGIDTFENGQLATGDYCLQIRDGFGCATGEACFTIGESSALFLMYEAIAACADTGGINLAISGGTSPYTIDWADLEGTDNPINRIALDTGTYEVTVMDNNGCTEMATITVPECEACNLPTITSIATTPSICTGNTGSIFIQIEEDERDYDFIYMPDLGQAFVTGNIRASLPIGKYRVLIVYKPNPACIMEVEVEVFEKNFDDLLPITSPSECGLATGRVLLLPTTNTYTWSDGFIGNTRSELPAGFYQIGVRDEVFDCETMLTVVVDEDNLLRSKVAINRAPTCGNSDGEVTISINGGSGDYSYSWEGGLPTQSNLSSGTYSVLVTDNRTGCKTPVVFTLLNEASELANIAIEEMIPASCPLVADGEVIFTATIDDLPTDALDTIISNGFTTFQNGQLPQGDYCLSIVDTSGCVYGQGCFTIDAPDFIAISTTIIPACDDGGSITVNVDGGTPPYTFDWEDVQGFADQAIRTDLPAGFYTLTVTDDNDCQTVLDTLWVTVCEPCPLIVGRDTIRYNIANCEGTQDICLDYDFDVRNPFIVTLNGTEIDLFDINSCGTDTIETYSPETLFGQGRIGAYTVTSWPVNDTIFTGSFNSLEELVAQMNEWDALGNWQFSAGGTLITGGASGSTYGQIDAIVDGTPITSFLDHETNIIKRGISTKLNVGVHEIMIQDPVTFCEDTLVVAITCTQTDTIKLVTAPNQMDTFCLSTMELAGALDTVILDCLTGDFVRATIEDEICVIIEGRNIGDDTLCVIICDEFEVCDTTIFEIDVNYDVLEDTIDVQSTNTFCLDTLGFSFEGAIISMTEICRDTQVGLAEYEFDLANFCITYTGKTLGTEMTCIEICDDLGVCDTLEFFLSIENDPPDLVIDTIFVGQTILYCFDSIIFPQEITFFENECPEDSGEKVDFFLDEFTYCVEIIGEAIGRETACIVLCDEDNNCDTAFFEIEVVEFLELPTANDDRDTTDKGAPIVLNVKENDIPFGIAGGDDGLEILEQPLFGLAQVNLDGSITYFSDEFCERTDEFTYSLCNSNGCDTATVAVYIACIDIVVFTAVSPNRDDQNDTFFISGIEEFPQSELTIFNRWGNIVYRVTNYQNDWTGTWKNNQLLPDGTYIYELRLNDPNDDRMFRGFLELHR